MTAGKHYADDCTLFKFIGLLSEMAALAPNRGTGDRFFAYDTAQSYVYGGSSYGWVLWEKHTVS